MNEEWGGGIFGNARRDNTPSKSKPKKSLMETFKEKFGDTDSDQPPYHMVGGATNLSDPEEQKAIEDACRNRDSISSSLFDKLLDGKVTNGPSANRIKLSTVEMPAFDSQGTVKVFRKEGFDPLLFDDHLDGNHYIGKCDIIISQYPDEAKRTSIIIEGRTSEWVKGKPILGMASLHVKNLPCPPGHTLVPDFGSGIPFLRAIEKHGVVKDTGIRIRLPEDFVTLHEVASDQRYVRVVKLLPPYNI